jgi:transposase
MLPAGRTRHELAQQFRTVVSAKQVAGLDAPLQPAEDSIVRELGSLAGGLRGDYAAFAVGLSLKWSNGPTEGHVNRVMLTPRLRPVQVSSGRCLAARTLI